MEELILRNDTLYTDEFIAIELLFKTTTQLMEHITRKQLLIPLETISRYVASSILDTSSPLLLKDIPVHLYCVSR